MIKLFDTAIRSMYVARKNRFQFLVVEVLTQSIWIFAWYKETCSLFLFFPSETTTRGKGRIFIGNFGAALKFQSEYSMLKTHETETSGNKKQIP